MRITSFALLRNGAAIKTVERPLAAYSTVRYEVHSVEQVIEWDRVAAESRAYMDSRTPEQIAALRQKALWILAEA